MPRVKWCGICGREICSGFLKHLPVPSGVKFLYFGRLDLQGPSNRHRGVITVAWKEAAPGMLLISFALCSPKDRWCKITGRDLAISRFEGHPGPYIIPCLYSPRGTVHEVVRAVLSHDFGRLEAIAPRAKWGWIPSWTKGLVNDY